MNKILPRCSDLYIKFSVRLAGNKVSLVSGIQYKKFPISQRVLPEACMMSVTVCLAIHIDEFLVI
jgi:hypothetical protein